MSPPRVYELIRPRSQRTTKAIAMVSSIMLLLFCHALHALEDRTSGGPLLPNEKWRFQPEDSKGIAFSSVAAPSKCALPNRSRVLKHRYLIREVGSLVAAAGVARIGLFGGSMNRHQLKGRISQARGKVREITGKLFGNKSVEAKGRAQQTGGRIEAGYGDLKDDIQKPR